MATKRICQACKELEHDACMNLLWDAGCPCAHKRWPEDRCRVRGVETTAAHNQQQWLCDLPRFHPGSHRGTSWVHEPIPVGMDRPPRLYGSAKWPFKWTAKRAIVPPGGFDPYDATAPHAMDARQGPPGRRGLYNP